MTSFRVILWHHLTEAGRRGLYSNSLPITLLLTKEIKQMKLNSEYNKGKGKYPKRT